MAKKQEKTLEDLFEDGLKDIYSQKKMPAGLEDGQSRRIRTIGHGF